MTPQMESAVAALIDIIVGDGEMMVSPMGPIPRLAAHVARRVHAPELMMSDGQSFLVDEDGQVESYMPFREVFEALWWGNRHVIMGASQIDQTGRQNIACVGPFERPKVQLLGFRGAPGNTACHTTSYWVGKHSKRVFVPKVDVATGLSAAEAADLRAVVTDLAVMDFHNGQMRLKSVHPDVTVDRVQAETGFALLLPDSVPTTRGLTDLERTTVEQLA
jgi:acyl CoA:acetate/3-ketoacid CoA transferase beta subunit